MELELMYPQIIVYALITSGLVLFAWKKKNKFKNGVIVANTKYIKNSNYYKKIMIKYRIYNILIKIVCLILILGCAVLTARINIIKKHEEEFHNRDILLCMDVSGSMAAANVTVFETMKETIETFKDEKFSIVLFNSSPVIALPFTNDYNYAISVLDDLIDAYNNQYRSNKVSYLYAGTNVGGGSSLIGDGLAYCASTFKKDEERAKVIILTTDNLSGGGIVTLEQASVYSKKNDIKVYPIGSGTTKYSKEGLINSANVTGGVYYDFNSYSPSDAKNHIEKINASSVTKNVYITRIDLPELIFPYLLFTVAALFLLEWRVRI